MNGFGRRDEWAKVSPRLGEILHPIGASGSPAPRRSGDGHRLLTCLIAVEDDDPGGLGHAGTIVEALRQKMGGSYRCVAADDVQELRPVFHGLGGRGGVDGDVIGWGEHDECQLRPRVCRQAQRAWQPDRPGGNRIAGSPKARPLDTTSSFRAELVSFPAARRSATT